jgi:hypothetical protein
MKTTIYIAKILIGLGLLFYVGDSFAEFTPPGAGEGSGGLEGQAQKGVDLMKMVIYVLYALAVMSGVIALYSGLMGLKKESAKGEHGQSDYGKHAMKILIGAILVAFTAWVGYASYTAQSEEAETNQLEQGF